MRGGERRRVVDAVPGNGDDATCGSGFVDLVEFILRTQPGDDFVDAEFFGDA